MTAKRSTSKAISIKRHKANQRERQRMHSLNTALDKLRDAIPIPQCIGVYGHDQEYQVSQKLSKIETLRMACNYIQLLIDILRCDTKLTRIELVDRLSLKISSMTSNLLKNGLNMDLVLMGALLHEHDFHLALQDKGELWSRNKKCVNKF